MNDTDLLASLIRNVPDFPQPGIQFKDITPILASGPGFQAAIRLFLDECRDAGARKIIGIDARGFIFGAAVAHAMGIGFVPVRKKGKLPYKTRSHAYTLEYGTNVVEMHEDAVQSGERVVLVDDLLATGGTAGAAIHLVHELGAHVVKSVFLIELEFLNGRSNLGGMPVSSFLKY